MTKSHSLAAFAPALVLMLGLNPGASPFFLSSPLTKGVLGSDNILEVTNGLSNPAMSEVLFWSRESQNRMTVIK